MRSGSWPARRMAFVVGVLALGWAARADAQPPTQIAQVSRVTAIAAFGGHLVWSARDPLTGSYLLVDRFGGQIAPLPVAERAVPFDVDLGKGPDGRTLATYSRCSTEPAAVEVDGLPRWPEGKGCTLRVYSFADRRERAVHGTRAAGASEFLPSVWGNQIAFFRKPAAQTHQPPLQLLLGRLDGTGPLKTLPAVKVPRIPARLGGVKWVAPTALDLVSDRIAYGWEWSGEGYGHGITEVRFLPSLSARRSALIGFGVVGEGCLHTLVSPVLDRRFITMARRETCARPSVERYDIASGRRFRALIPSDPVALARSPQSPLTTATLLIAAPPSFAEPIDPCTSEPSTPQAPPRGPCNLTELQGLRFSPAARRGPLPESIDEIP